METTALTFGAPHWLWALLVLPLIAGLFLWSHRRGQALVAKIVAVRLRDQLSGSVSPLRRILRASLLLVSLALAIVSLAQPRLGFTEKETNQKGRDVIVAIDTSRSMLATDVAPTRLARAKLFTQDLVALLQGDRVGLVAFAGSAFLQAPLTLDYNAVTNALEELDTMVIPTGGTNIASAITAAREAFGKAEGQTRALIILTDGEELDADGIAAAKQASQEGIRIFSVGIGSPEGSLISMVAKTLFATLLAKPLIQNWTNRVYRKLLLQRAVFSRSSAPRRRVRFFKKGSSRWNSARPGFSVLVNLSSVTSGLSL